MTAMKHDPAVVAFTGLAGAGKDTAAAHLQAEHGFVALAFADPINDMLAVLLEAFDVDYAVLHERHLKEQPIPQIPGAPSARHLKQALGDCMRAIHPDIWVRALAHRAGVQDLPRSAPVHHRLCITDVRYPNEAALVASLGGTVIRLQRPQAAPVRAHSSEEQTAYIEPAVTIHNYGITPHALYAALDDAVAKLSLPAP